jgi:hypothetical protein
MPVSTRQKGGGLAFLSSTARLRKFRSAFAIPALAFLKKNESEFLRGIFVSSGTNLRRDMA